MLQQADCPYPHIIRLWIITLRKEVENFQGRENWDRQTTRERRGNYVKIIEDMVQREWGKVKAFFGYKPSCHLFISSASFVGKAWDVFLIKKFKNNYGQFSVNNF